MDFVAADDLTLTNSLSDLFRFARFQPVAVDDAQD